MFWGLEVTTKILPPGTRGRADELPRRPRPSVLLGASRFAEEWLGCEVGALVSGEVELELEGDAPSEGFRRQMQN
jgi:hypothetical protein